MGLRIFENKEDAVKLKATIQKTGKLGFTEATSTSMKLDENTAIQFAGDEDDPSMLYLINHVPADQPNTFKVCRAGRYFYVNARVLFESLGFDYEKSTIMFDLKRDQTYADMEVYLMKKRVLPRKNK